MVSRPRTLDGRHGIVLLGFAFLTVVPTLWRFMETEPMLNPGAHCPDGAFRRPDGQVVCRWEAETASKAIEALAPRSALWAGTKIDLNQASASDLTVVPGIGTRLAARILANRKEQGSFRHLEEVTRVKGVGPKLLERMRPFIEVRSAGSTERPPFVSPGR